MKPVLFIPPVLTIIFWGVSLVSTKILLENNFSPNLITFLRFLLATSFMLLFLNKQIQGKILHGDHRYFLAMGLGGTAFFYFFENTGLKYTTVANTALITATIPLFTLLAARVIYAKKLSWQNLLGIIAGLSGTFLLFSKDLLHSRIYLKGDLFIFGSVVMWVIYSFCLRKVINRYSNAFIVHRTFIYGLIVLLPIVLLENRSWQNISLDWTAFGHLIFLSVFCSFLGYYFWNQAIHRLGV
ncbi:MAG: DMT family transporter, partial [Candidatus Cloacimonetes bacterium]|nr:DMT family transporter [Candidatus Cloacimonadota bacterium]